MTSRGFSLAYITDLRSSMVTILRYLDYVRSKILVAAAGLAYAEKAYSQLTN